MATKKSEAGSLMPVSRTQLLKGSGGVNWVLLVTGETPSPSTEVWLQPARYDEPPSWWRVEVLGRETGEPDGGPGGVYSVSLPLDGPRGVEGVELVGLDYNKRIAPAPPPPSWSRVLRVDSVRAQEDPFDPGILRVSARGLSAGPGWRWPRLLPLGDGVKDDGTLVLEFVADPPTRIGLPGSALVVAQLTWPQGGAHGAPPLRVRVQAKTNSEEVEVQRG